MATGSCPVPFKDSWNDRSDTVRWTVGGRGLALYGVESRSTSHRRTMAVSGSWLVEGEDKTAEQASADDVLDAGFVRAIGEAYAVHSRNDRCLIERLILRRDYRNSDCVSFLTREEVWTASISTASGESLRRCAASLADLPRTLSRMLRLLHGMKACQADSVPRCTLLLESDVAGVVVHELLGHAAEEGDVGVGDRVLPAGWSATVRARRQGFDDEGTHAADWELVRDGVMVSAPLDRRTSLHSLVQPGSAWGGAHSICPRKRLTDIVVSADNCPRMEAPAGIFIHCRAIRNGRYFRGACLLNVFAANLVKADGRRVPIAPFWALVDGAALRRAEMCTEAGVPAQTNEPMRGWCFKNGDALSSSVSCPPFFVRGVRTWPI